MASVGVVLYHVGAGDGGGGSGSLEPFDTKPAVLDVRRLHHTHVWRRNERRWRPQASRSHTTRCTRLIIDDRNYPDRTHNPAALHQIMAPVASFSGYVTCRVTMQAHVGISITNIDPKRKARLERQRQNPLADQSTMVQCWAGSCCQLYVR